MPVPYVRSRMTRRRLAAWGGGAALALQRLGADEGDRVGQAGGQRGEMRGGAGRGAVFHARR